MKENNTHIIVLAAGHGKRMGNPDLPKVLVPFAGKPIISYLLDAVDQLGYSDRLTIVVGQKAELVQQYLGPEYQYVYQTEQLGTGHAVACAKAALEGRAENIMVLYGDHPLVTAATIDAVTKQHANTAAVVTMATFTISDFDDWRKAFYDYGRVIRNASGAISAIVEKKDATPEQLAIKELNPSYYCFNAAWLWGNIGKLKQENAQREYYLTDLVYMAVQQGHSIQTVTIDAHEALGVNTPEQLAVVEQFK